MLKQNKLGVYYSTPSFIINPAIILLALRSLPT